MRGLIPPISAAAVSSHGCGTTEHLSVVANWPVYAVRFACGVFVLHVFQKKAKRGIATPKADIDLIRQRYKAAEEIAKELEP